MVRILLLSDILLGHRSAFLENQEKKRQRIQDIQNSFKRSMEYALKPENNIHIIVFAGNLFDHHNPDKESLRLSQEWIHKLLVADKEVIIVPGKNDHFRYINSVFNNQDFYHTHLIKNNHVAYYDTIYVNEYSLHIYATSDMVDSVHELDNLNFQDDPGIHLVIAPAGIKEKFNIKKTKFDFFIAGQNAIVPDNRKFYTVSTIEGHNFDQTGDRFLSVLQIRDDKIEIEQENFTINEKTFKLEEINFDKNSLNTHKKTVEFVIKKYADKNAFMRLIFSGKPKFIFKQKDYYKDLGEYFFHLEIVDNTQIHTDILKSKVYPEGLILEKISKYIKSQELDKLGPALKLILSKL